MERLGKNRVPWTLMLILFIAAVFRFYELNWDEGQHTHPDERWIAMVAPSIHWPQNASDLLDPRRSTLNPLWMPDGQGGGQIRNFAYGHLPLYLHALFGRALAALGKDMLQWGPAYQDTAYALMQMGEYDANTLVGRALAVLCDLGTIYLVFLLGWRIYNRSVGLLGAALVACAVTHIQLSHYAAFDVMTTFFVILSVYGSVCVVQADPKRWWPTVWSGAAAGLAVASKFSAVPLVAVLVIAQVIRFARHQDMTKPYAIIRLVRRAWPDVLLSLVVAFLAFFITSPFAILDFKLYLKQIVEQSTMVRGAADWPYTRQYRNTTPFVYHIVQQLRWGLGWPLGIAAFAGFGWVIVRQVKCWFRRGGATVLERPYAEELVMLGWAAPYFVLTGSFMVKFMRYMLPLLPLFILMGAAMMLEIAAISFTAAVKSTAADSTAGANGRRAQYALGRILACLPYLVLLSALIWSLAFIWVYAQEHPWIQASKWIYENVPDGSVIAVEHWDDHLPLSLPTDYSTSGAHNYQHVELPMYEPDNYEKYDLIRSLLHEADYIVLSTNRLYRTIPRLPERYPVSTEFYRLLFAEQLGFKRTAEFTAYPGLFGMDIVDDAADESFTVYDHPKPIVFRKERDLSNLEWDRLFAEALATPPVWEFAEQKKAGDLLAFLGGGPGRQRKPVEEGQEVKTLLLDRPVGDLPVVADWGWNRWANNSTVVAVLIWWLAVTLLGWLGFPIMFVVFRGMRDRGYLLSRSMSLLLVGYLVWLPSALHWLKNGLPLTLAAMGLVAMSSALLLRRHWAEFKAFLREHWRVILLGEAVFGLALLFFVGIRILNPDLWQPWNGGEKGMDMAYLNACMRSAYFPPYDPYYSDGYLNYYYYGQFLVSIVARLTGIRTPVAFNLAVPLYFALTASGAFSVGYTLAVKLTMSSKVGGKGQDQTGGELHRLGIVCGLMAAVFVVILGNLDNVVHIVEQLGQLSTASFTSQLPGLTAIVRAFDGIRRILFHDARFPGFNYWDRSRVIGNGTTINEFPYWSFLFADLHPHMMNLPFTVLVAAFALNWLLRRRPQQDLGSEPNRTDPGVLSERKCLSGLPRSEWTLVKSSFCYVWQRLDWGEVLNWVLWPVALGALIPINTWDFPAFAGLSGLILLFVWIRTRGKQGVGPALVAGITLTIGSVLLYAPFLKYYTAIYVGVGWSLARTSTNLGEFLTVWGLMLFVAVSFLLFVWADRRMVARWGVLRLLRLCARYLSRLHRLEHAYRLLVHRTTQGYRRSLWGIGALILVLSFFAWKGYWVLFLMAPLLLLTLVLVSGDRMSDERRFALALIFTAFLLLVGVELIYLKDWLDGLEGFWRMNTLFKFYMQVWVLLGLAAGAVLPEVWQAVERWKTGWRWAWQITLTLLFLSAFLFVPLGTAARVMDRFPNAQPPLGTLDGMAFMTVGVYSWPTDQDRIALYGDDAALRWLEEHVKGTPVVAEAPVGYYREFGLRVASFTGLPTLVGMHQSEQRYSWQVGQRSGLADELFKVADLQRTLSLIKELHVKYVYLGPLERTQYPNAAAKFAQLATGQYLSVVYQNDLVTIYQVNEEL